jgi:oxalate decarboxylase
LSWIPQGYGHSIENVGAKPCRVLIGFNAGGNETIDLSEWIAGNPTDVLATNFSKPAPLFEKFPRNDVFISSKDGPRKPPATGKTEVHAGIRLTTRFRPV